MTNLSDFYFVAVLPVSMFLIGFGYGQRYERFKRLKKEPR